MLTAMYKPLGETTTNAEPNAVDESSSSDEPLQDISPEGVDRNQIRWMLSLTPAERLQVLQDFVDTFGKVDL